ncbi:MAG: hypothetical protein HOH65_14875 [Rhodospirillaceae bacterium]|nr:hypothetical protein [Rhodospirillaceae bacterium]
MRRAFAYFLLWGAIVGFGLFPWFGRESVQAARLESVVASETQVSQHRSIKPLEAYAHTLERPLFSATRRPARVIRPAPVATTKPTRFRGYRVTGIVGSEAGRMAILQQVSGGEVLVVREGETVGGWTVSTIDGDGVTMRLGEHMTRLNQGSTPRGTAPRSMGTRSTESSGEAMGDKALGGKALGGRNTRWLGSGEKRR